MAHTFGRCFEKHKGNLDINKVSSVAFALMQDWRQRRIDLINVPTLLVGYCSRYGDYVTQQNIDVLPWPAVSLDLLPIKHV
jgi:hypothetical protein